MMVERFTWNLCKILSHAPFFPNLIFIENLVKGGWWWHESQAPLSVFFKKNHPYKKNTQNVPTYGNGGEVIFLYLPIFLTPHPFPPPNSIWSRNLRRGTMAIRMSPLHLFFQTHLLRIMFLKENVVMVV